MLHVLTRYVHSVQFLTFKFLINAQKSLPTHYFNIDEFSKSLRIINTMISGSLISKKL